METSHWPSNIISTSLRYTPLSLLMIIYLTLGDDVLTELFLLQDLTMFSDSQGCQVIWGVADYWVSRARWNPEDKLYHLLGKDTYWRDIKGRVHSFLSLS